MSSIDQPQFRLTHGRRPPVGLGCLLLAVGLLAPGPLLAADADTILHGGKIVTVDSAFTISEAVAIKAGRIVAVGSTADVIARERGPRTQMIDLEGRTVLPGLIDSHVHPLGAALSEHTTPFVVFQSFADIQGYIREQASKTPKGEWIMVPKTFPGRLREMRMPTRDVLDAALEHPVFYDASYESAVNSYALEMSGITKDTPDPPREGARIIRDANGEPTGVLTGGATALLKDVPRATQQFTKEEQANALERMLNRYVAAGLTTITDRGATGTIPLYNKLKDEQRLPIRVVMTYRASLEELPQSTYVTNQGDEWLKFGAFKVGLDGGMNAGTSFMREPWGPYAAQLFGFYEPDNRGDLRMPLDELARVMRVARDKGWQMTAHSQGGGAVDALLDVFEMLNRDKPIAPTRSHLVHASFLSAESIARCKRLGILVDVQPEWFYRDGVAMKQVTSPEAMRYFNPYQSLVKAGVPFAGGTDHMIGWDKNTAINAYNPFLGMWIAITRKTVPGEVIHPEERLTREQALRMYTTWGALMNHAEGDRGSIEAGKLADVVVIDRDYLTCPEEDIRRIEPVMTIVEGRIAYSRSTATASRERNHADSPQARR